MKLILDAICYVTPMRRLYQFEDSDARMHLKLTGRLFTHKTRPLSFYEERASRAAIDAFEAAGGMVRIFETSSPDFEDPLWRKENGVVTV